MVAKEGHRGQITATHVTSGPTGSPQLMRRMNRSQILTALRDHGPMTRPALSRATGLSKITVDAVATELLSAARIVEAPEPPTGSPGRRARVLSFRYDSAYVAAIDVGSSKIRIGIADLSGRYLVNDEIELPPAEPGQRIAATTRRILDRAIDNAGLAPTDVRAVCLATPGVVDPETGRVTLAPQLAEWGEVDLVGALTIEGGAPVHIENEVHLAVVGEQWKGAARGRDDIAYLHLGVGVGLGIVKAGQLIRGAHGAAGEIGYAPLHPTALPLDTNVGAFEWLVGGDAYRRAALALIDGGYGSTLLAAADGDRSLLDAELIYRLAEEGDPEAESIVDRILSITAVGVASVTAVLDPSLVIIGGGISRAGEWMLARLSEKVRELTPHEPDFALAGLGGDAVLLGAVRRAVEACEHELIDLINEQDRS